MLDPKRRVESKGYFKKYVLKYFKVFITWSIFYTLLEIVIFSPENNWNFNTIITLMVNGYYHLGYFYYFIAFFVFLPIFRVFIENTSERLLQYLLVLWFVFTTLLPTLFIFTDFNLFSNWISNYSMNLMGGLVGYFFLGYYLNTIEIKKKNRFLIYVIGVITLLFTIYETRMLSIEIGSTHYLFRTYSAFTTGILSSSIYIFFKYELDNLLKRFGGRINKITLVISSCTFGIYLIHPFVLNIIRSFEVNDYMAGSPARRYPLVVLVVFLISFVLIYFGRIVKYKFKKL